MSGSPDRPGQCWLGVHFARLPLETVSRRLADGETAAGVVLVADHRVMAMDAAARETGIAAGCSLATALGVCPGLVHFERDEAMEARRLGFLAELALRFTSRASLAEPDGLVLEVGRSLRLFGGLRRLSGEVRALYRGLGHEVRLGSGSTPLAALALARSGAAAVDDVPLDRIGLDPATVERFANMGIFRLGQVLVLPAAELGRRFDAGLLSWLARLTGRSPDPRAPVEPRESFASSVHLLSSVSDLGALLFPMRRLAGELASWLAARHLGAGAIRWTFTALRGQKEHGEEASLEVRFARPRGDAGALFDHTRLKLDGFRLPQEVMSVSLAAEALVAAETAVRELLPGAPGSASPALELVDTLAAKLGDGALHCLRTLDDHRPEHASGTFSPSAGRVASDDGGVPGPLRPLWLLKEPCRVRADDFTLLGNAERIETGWWDGSVARDYFIAVDPGGVQCWLFRELRRAAPGEPGGEGGAFGRWFLHGYFA